MRVETVKAIQGLEYNKVLCIYGYSQAIFLPCTLIAFYPNGILHFCIFGYAGLHALIMLWRNFAAQLEGLSKARRSFFIFFVLIS